MINAINNIYSINKLVEQSSDDQIIRATNTQLKTDDSIKTYFYVRKNKIDQIFQKLTDWTDGAKTKQALAKNQIISNLKIIKDNPEFDKNFPNKDRREQALALMNKIIMTVSTTEKDITSSMIKKDLRSLNSFLSTYETIEKKSEHSNPVEDSSEGDIANSEAESDLNAAKGNNTDSNITELADIDIGEGVTVVMHPSEIDNFENNIKANISKNMSSYLSKLANVTSVDVAEVVFNTEDPEVDGSPYKETNSKLADSGTSINASTVKKEGIQESDDGLANMMKLNKLPELMTLSGLANMQKLNALPNLEAITSQVKNTDTKQADSPPKIINDPIEVAELVFNNTNHAVDGIPNKEISSTPADGTVISTVTTAPIGKAIEPGTDSAEAATKSNPSSAQSSASSTAETKSTATDNPYLKSLETEWKAKNGVYEVSKPFHITYDVPASHIIAQAYLLPVGRQLKLPGNTKKSSGEESFVIKNAEAPKLTRVGGNKLVINQRTAERLEKIRTELFDTYLDTFVKISSEYKELKLGEKLETLVIVPISSVSETLADIESEALANALHAIQIENPTLKIVISADKDTHAAKIQADYVKVVSKSV